MVCPRGHPSRRLPAPLFSKLSVEQLEVLAAESQALVDKALATSANRGRGWRSHGVARRITYSSMSMVRTQSIIIAVCATCIALFLLSRPEAAQSDRRDEFAKARATDPVALGWMVGSPPPPDKQIRYHDGSFYRFPQRRWSFSNWRQFRPTVNISRGDGLVRALPRAERTDIDAVTFVPIGGIAPVTWADSLTLNYTDGIVILHRGRIVYERYLGALTADRPHIAFSVSKSFTGTIAAMLIAEGALEARAPVSRYLPELMSSGFGDATVADVLNMTTAIEFTENYGVSRPRWRRIGGRPVSSRDRPMIRVRGLFSPSLPVFRRTARMANASRIARRTWTSSAGSSRVSPINRLPRY